MTSTATKFARAGKLARSAGLRAAHLFVPYLVFTMTAVMALAGFAPDAAGHSHLLSLFPQPAVQAPRPPPKHPPTIPPTASASPH